jgi:hypothetical protein
MPPDKSVVRNGTESIQALLIRGRKGWACPDLGLSAFLGFERVLLAE